MSPPDDTMARTSAAAEALPVPVETRLFGLPTGIWPRILAPLVIGALVLGLWEFAVRWNDVPPYVLPGPLLVGRTLVADWASLSASLWVTLRITFLALAAAVVIGVALAVLFSQSKWLEMALLPYAIVLQVTPIVAIAPLIIIWANDIDLSLLICAWIVAFFPILSNTILGLSAADHNLVNLFELYGASRWQTLRYLRLPAALPYFLAGLKVSGGRRRCRIRRRNRRQRLGAGLSHPGSWLPAQDSTCLRSAGDDLALRRRDLPGNQPRLASPAAPLARKRDPARELIPPGEQREVQAKKASFRSAGSASMSRNPVSDEPESTAAGGSLKTMSSSSSSIVPIRGSVSAGSSSGCACSGSLLARVAGCSNSPARKPRSKPRQFGRGQIVRARVARDLAEGAQARIEHGDGIRDLVDALDDAVDEADRLGSLGRVPVEAVAQCRLGAAFPEIPGDLLDAFRRPEDGPGRTFDLGGKS